MSVETRGRAIKRARPEGTVRVAMTETRTAEDVGLSRREEPDSFNEAWESIFASLARLETGLQTIEANLVRVQVDLEEFKTALDGDAA